MSRPLDRILTLVLRYLQPMLRPLRDRSTALWEAARALRADAAQATRPLPMRLNAGMLMLDFVISSALGYPFWILAARLFDPADVGMGSAVLSAMRLCSLVALIGIGSAIILLLPRQEHRPSDVLSSAFTLAIVSGIAISVAFLVLSTVFFGELGRLASSPAYILAFLTLNVVVIVAKTFDSTFMALRRADKVVTRSIAQGLVALVVLAIIGILSRSNGMYAIVLAWIPALLVSSLVGRFLLRAALPGHRLRASASRATTGAMLGVGLPNFALKLAITLPVHAIPLVVIEVLSPAANAYWRAVWMFGMLVMMVPSASSTALFAEGSNRPDLIDKSARQGVQMSLALGIPMAAAMALTARWGLSLMGAGYAEAGTTSLRILVIGVIPQTFIAAYVARQRVASRLREPTLFGTLSSLISIGGAVAGGALYGLPGIALAWLVAQSLTGFWAAWKIREIYDKSLEPAQVVVSTLELQEYASPQFAKQGD